MSAMLTALLRWAETTSLFAQSEPKLAPGTLDVILVPGLLTFIGALVFGASMAQVRVQGRLLPSRFIGYGLVALGFLASLSTLYKLYAFDGTGPIYRASIYNHKALFMHYATPIIVGAALIGMVATEIAARKLIHGFQTPDA